VSGGDSLRERSRRSLSKSGGTSTTFGGGSSCPTLPPVALVSMAFTAHMLALPMSSRNAMTVEPTGD
jgi:hypothetical protein